VKIEDADTGKVLSEKNVFKKAIVSIAAEGKIKIGDEIFNACSVRIVPDGDVHIIVGRMKYRGTITLLAKADGIDVVNTLDIEDYLKGVLPREMNMFWPAEALKAQAIASRSFAVSKALGRRGKEYDLTSDTFFQVYGGVNAECWRTSRIVDGTRGMVLAYNGEILPAYFHACCGGHTEDISMVWKGHIPPLCGVKCGWCGWSPRFKWDVELRAGEFSEKLNKSGYGMWEIKDIVLEERDASGRIKYLDIVSDDNKTLKLTIEDLNAVLGWGKLKSADVYIKKESDGFKIYGYGWGHGVGMCQWGALSQGLRGRDVQSILDFYYPGSRIADLKRVLQRK